MIGWIPVTEQLPKINQWVLITIYAPEHFDEDDERMLPANYDIVLGHRYSEDKWTGNNDFGGWGNLKVTPDDPEDYRVIAWLPVEPYKFKEGQMESEKRFEELYSQASGAMENYDPIEPNVKIFEVIPESSVPEKKYSINEILEVIDDVYFNELGPIPGADIHDFYAALNARFVEGGMEHESNSSL